MYRIDKRSGPRLFACMALFAGAHAGLFAQSPEAAAPESSPAHVVKPAPTPEELGDVLMARRRYQAAAQAYKQEPHKSAAVWNKMGIANQMMFNWQEAARCYRAALKLEPHNAKVMNNLGTVFDSQKEFGDAQRMYRKALKYEPRSALVRKNLGTALMARHKYKEGWKMYESALAIDPQIFDRGSELKVDNPSSVQQRGAINYYMARGCVRVGLNARAIEYLRMALNEGFTSPKKIAEDSDFARLRGIPEFDQLMAAEKAR